MTGCDPQAPQENIVTCGKARFTLLSDRMLRLEWAEDGVFEDRATLKVCNRRTAKLPFRVVETEDGIHISTDALRLRFVDDGGKLSAKNLAVDFRCAGKPVSWHPGLKDRANLGGTHRTLDCFDGDRKKVWNKANADEESWERRPLPAGLLSRNGWSVVDDSDGPVMDPSITDRSWAVGRPPGPRQDCYLLAYGHDYQSALRDAAAIFGRQPLVPRYALGYWYSRYFAYMDRDIEDLVEQFNRFDVPLDVMVIDMDWHLPGWSGTTWCSDYFPDPQAHLAWLAKRGIKVALNLHPADGVGQHEAAFPAMKRALGAKKVKELQDKHGLSPSFEKHYRKLYAARKADYDYIPFDITDPSYMEAYFTCLHRPLEKDGVDIWWMDWQQGETTAIPGLDTLPWINQLHWEDQERNPDRADTRPLGFSRFGGVGGGRYPIGFSGDTFITWDSLAYQPWFTATASNVLYGMWSHDIGGHMGGNNTPELYTRWMQFGIHSPILRTHASKHKDADRRIFIYPEPYCDLMMDAIHQRYEMVPYIYGQMRQAWETGISIVRPMYYAHPDRDEAYAATGQYQFGDDMIVAPVCRPLSAKDDQAPVRVWLPKGRWYDTAHGRLHQGGDWIEARYLLAEIPVFARAGAVIPGQQRCRRLAPGSYRDLLFTIYPGADGQGTLYEDDGVSLDYQQGRSATISVSHQSSEGRQRIHIGPAQGDFTGFRDQRSLELRLPGSVPPVEVIVDQQEIPFTDDLATAAGAAWAYDGDSATTTIRLPCYSARQGCVCSITPRKGISRKRLDGLPGRSRRLVAIARRVAAESYFRTFFKEERLAVRVAQAGKRISRRPETMARELRSQAAELSRLPDSLAAYARGYRKRIKERPCRRADTLQTIRKQLLQMMRQFDD